MSHRQRVNLPIAVCHCFVEAVWITFPRRSTASAKQWHTRHRGIAEGQEERPGGFSLLEVVLALAILAGSIATLGEVARRSLRNAQIARDSTQAQLLCESKMAEITAGITLPDTVTDVPFESLGSESGINGIMGDDKVVWLYSISLESTDEPGIATVCVTVTQDLPENKRIKPFSLVRWIPDPGMEYSEGLSEEEAGM